MRVIVNECQQNEPFEYPFLLEKVKEEEEDEEEKKEIEEAKKEIEEAEKKEEEEEESEEESEEEESEEEEEEDDNEDEDLNVLKQFLAFENDNDKRELLEKITREQIIIIRESLMIHFLSDNVNNEQKDVLIRSLKLIHSFLYPKKN